MFKIFNKVGKERDTLIYDGNWFTYYGGFEVLQ